MGIFEQSLALHEREELRTMALDMFFDLTAPLYRWLSRSLKQKLRKRAFPDIDRRLVRTHPAGAPAPPLPSLNQGHSAQVCVAGGGRLRIEICAF
jgi:hypothetical protein